MVEVTGELRTWHRVTLTFDGKESIESGALNPFTEYRLNVEFTNGNSSYTVPGYFAADGNAGESGASKGNKWRVHFTPDQEGEWRYKVSFRMGEMVAISEKQKAGTPVLFDGAKGSFQVKVSDKVAPDFRAKGRLQYVGKRYLRFAGNGEYFLKGGADAPEVLLAYRDFDGTYQHDGSERFLKDWAPHVQDWQAGDPSWQGGKGKGLIGALNYLSSEGMNAFSFLTMNVTGDGKNVWPWTSHDERFRFDCSKLDQWEIVFAHAQSKGLYLHFKTQETENDHLLDGGDLGPERKLYYRELIARFGHHLALNWNLGEENTQSTEQQKAMAAFFHRHDPYHHHIVIHTYPGQQQKVYAPLLGKRSALTGASLQTSPERLHQFTKDWIHASTEAGKPWVVANDEQNPANEGASPHANYPGMEQADNHDKIRHHCIYGNLMAGGGGVEYYFGYKLPESDLTCNDWRSRDGLWDYTRIALEFFQQEVPFQKMECMDELTERKDDYVLAEAGETYLIYLPAGNDEEIVLEFPNKSEPTHMLSGQFYTIDWFDPIKGGVLQPGSKTSIRTNGQSDLGQPPHSPEQDWLVLVKRSRI